MIYLFVDDIVYCQDNWHIVLSRVISLLLHGIIILLLCDREKFIAVLWSAMKRFDCMIFWECLCHKRLQITEVCKIIKFLKCYIAILSCLTWWINPSVNVSKLMTRCVCALRNTRYWPHCGHILDLVGLTVLIITQVVRSCIISLIDVLLFITFDRTPWTSWWASRFVLYWTSFAWHCTFSESMRSEKWLLRVDRVLVCVLRAGSKSLKRVANYEFLPMAHRMNNL